DLKVRIRAWIKDKRSSVFGEKDSIKKELNDIDRLLDGGDVSDSNLLRRSELHRNLYTINQIESKEYLQKSKIKWAIEGDENSKFFHGLIKTLPACNSWSLCRWHLIRLAVWNCRENKAPGPDGYSFEFFRKYWNLVGSDLCDVVEHFFETGSFPNGCNSSFVALILKITDAKFVNDFRPISLIRSVYKVVTKVLANRLALVISNLISDTQSAFVAIRQILDGPFILNELLHWCKRKKKQVMFFKVDFAKAYDSVRWDYLLDVLEAFGFGVFKGVHLHGSTSISHLFYADDVMFIGEWSDDNLKGVGVPSSIVMQVASSIGCGVLHKQSRYLGVMVGVCMSRHNAWASTVDKLRYRLSKWKVKPFL
nr:RNA-directed DNA polymerase, eukaryota, reverse transcriptase zinc-binding domain protein [Tanacetum cinerariifolium]